jgi:hypothetical protein
MALVAVTARLSTSVCERLNHLVGRPWLIECFLQVAERIRSNCAPLPADHHEPERSIEHRELFFCERSREFFRKTQARYSGELTVGVVDIVLEVDFAVADDRSIGKMAL